MPNRTTPKLTPLFLLFSLLSTAAWSDEYKQPEEMTDEDYSLMNAASDNYNQCLQEDAVKVMDQMDDPRHVADHAMKQCATILEQLNSELEARNFPPHFRQGYIRRITNRSARNLLAGLMASFSARQPAPEQP